MTRVTCGLTATNRDQLRNPTPRSVIEYGLPFLVGEFALLTYMAKQTIVYVNCRSGAFRLFRCFFIAFV